MVFRRTDLTQRMGLEGTGVVVIGPTPPPYHGVAVMTCHVVQALAKQGLLVQHLDTRDPQPLDTLGVLNWSNLTLGARHAWQLHRILRSKRSATHVILPISQGTWGFLRDAVLALVTRLHRRRLILHLHGAAFGEFYAGSHPPLRLAIREVCRQADGAWALTPDLEHVFDGLVPRGRVQHVENVVSCPRSGETNGARHHRRAPASKAFRLLYLANLRREKGIFDLLDALRLLKRSAGGWELRVVGEGTPAIVRSLEAEASALAAAGGPRVAVLPPRYESRKWNEYENADAFVFPPRASEGQPLVLLEAMAAGLPIVTTRVGGIPHTVRDGVEGLVVAPGSPDHLARALLRIASDAPLRERFGRAARQRYLDCYRPERLGRDLAAAFPRGTPIGTAGMVTKAPAPRNASDLTSPHC